MSSAPTLQSPPPGVSRGPGDSPDEYRMTIGEHLEELRRRLIYALLGFGVAAAVCFLFGRQVTEIFCRPLAAALRAHDLPPNLYTHELSDAFMVYIEISLVTAGALSAPWMVYQIWKFVAAGLYPHERKYVTRYVPLSMALLVIGMVFLYFVVLPMVLDFFLMWSLSMSLPTADPPPLPPSASTPASIVPTLPGDPMHPLDGQIWFDSVDRQVKIFLGHQIRTLPFGTDSLTTPLFSLPEYIDLVLRLLLIFGIAFQLPLVVMALARLGIVPISTMRKYRRQVYFIITIVAAVLTPGDVVTAMLALLFPMVILYEFGVFLAARGMPPEEPDAAEA